MATGQNAQLTGRIGEHLVTAELARRGIIATPFSGNVPQIDILAYAKGVAAPIQVKTIDLAHGDSWQFDIRRFLNIEKTDAGQNVIGKKANFNRSLLCIFVALKGPLGAAEFYIFRYGWLQDFFTKHYKGRRPPKNINSFHCAIWIKDMKIHLDKWGIIEKRFS